MRIEETDYFAVYSMRLMEAFHFLPADLIYNVQGKLSNRQWWYLLRWQWLLSICAVILLFPLLSYSASLRGSGTMLILAGTVLSSILVVYWGRIFIDLYHKQVLEVTGTCSQREKIGARTREYYLNIGNNEFLVELHKYQMIQEPGVYRAYYVPYSRLIVAIEWLPDYGKS